MSMFEPFTESAREAMVYAHETATGSNKIDVEDILLGILATDSAGRWALSAAGVKLEEAKRVVEQCRLQESGAYGKIEKFQQEKIFSPHAKRIIEFAFEHARKLHHNYIGTEHLLLGILEQNAHKRSRAITQVCGDRAAIEAEIRRIVATTPRESKESQPAAARAHEVSGSMWEPFAEDARQAVVNAQAAAMQARLPYIGSEHLLLGIMAVGSGVGWETLNQAGVQKAAVDAVARKYSVKSKAGESDLVFTVGAKQAIERAFAARFQMKHGRIGTGHLLIALVDGDDHIERIFSELHIERELIKRSAIDRLRSS